MLRGLTIFTGLLGVVLLGTLVVLQVQRGLDDTNATPAAFEADETLEEAEVALGAPARDPSEGGRGGWVPAFWDPSHCLSCT